MPRSALLPEVQPILVVVTMLLLGGCANRPPPASAPPTADLALSRMHASVDCGGGVQAKAKIDHFGKGGRVRGELLLFATLPSRLRMDAVSPFGVALASLAADGAKFSLADLREKRFFYGPAKACNLAKLTTVRVPPTALVGLLRGTAPVLKHDQAATRMSWDGHGYYRIVVDGSNQTQEEIHLAPHPDDYQRPWAEQRFRVLDVTVRQSGVVLYHAELEQHSPAPMAKMRVDPDGIDPPILPSGPSCTAELPRRIHLEVPGTDEDVLFRYDEVAWNPPIIEGLFTLARVPGLADEFVDCTD